jgi:diguanylate cyclase (GGDEF)-like protein/PAS domain S-box-containing protein
MSRVEESKYRFRQVIDSCRDAFVEVGPDYRVTEWSSRAEELFGWSREEMTGRPVADIFDAKGGDLLREGVQALRKSARVDGCLTLGRFHPTQGEGSPLVVQLEMLHRDGHPVPVSGAVFATGTGPEFRMAGFVRPSPGAGNPTDDLLAPDPMYDALTGLATRSHFSRRLAMAIDELENADGSVAVVVFDLDRFKAINDAMGHDVGDELLVAVVARLRLASGVVRPFLARLGGDEFLALFAQPKMGAREAAEEFAERTLAALEDPFDIGGSEIFLTASVGISATDDAEADASTLLSNADAAMHDTKNAGGGAQRFFGESMRQQVVERMTTEHSLHRALDRRELTLFYQPVVAISGNGTMGVEALIRWQHPEQGLVPPDRFISVAEESGLIIPIGAWVLEEACRQLRSWRESGESGPAGRMEVNLSARQVDHPELVATVERILEQTGLPPENLTLEITESALMRDAVSALQVLQALKTIGVALAIDDFGTGYSSLSYLQRFPLDILKVDKSFVNELGLDQGTEIVAAVINLAHALGLNVVAEGVETEEQLTCLQQLGCDYAQGYLFSKPVPASQLAEGLALAPGGGAGRLTAGALGA